MYTYTNPELTPILIHPKLVPELKLNPYQDTPQTREAPVSAPPTLAPLKKILAREKNKNSQQNKLPVRDVWRVKAFQ